MAEFKRSRLSRKNDEAITKKTVFLGVLTVLFVVFVVVFGLPFLIKFSVFLGDMKKNGGDNVDKTLPPVAPRLVIPFEATNSGKINVSGLAEAKVNVELFNNGDSLGTTEVDDEGEFLFESIDLTEGENSFTAVASSEETGVGQESEIANIVFDKESPNLTLTNPVEDSLEIDYADFDIIGETEVDASVTINGKLASVDSKGVFKLKLQLDMGKNDLEVISRDIAGNETRKKISITYSL